ncbi:hypothetical protein BD779DRAFT_1472308 [Infundibulicybe gibba]|nr:hypothetical protein BD779DRAFT_1472308 [Infundibulicybe gibba]
MPIEVKSHNPHDDPQQTFHPGVAFTELYGHSDGDGLSSGTLTMNIQNDPEIALDCPRGVLGIVTKGVLVLVDSDTPDDRHTFTEGQVFHVTKGSTFKWGAGSNCEGFYAVPKPIGLDVSQLNLKKPVF